MDTFSFSPPKNLSERRNWLLAVTSFEATNSVFSITDEDNSFSITTPVNCNSEVGEETLIKRNNLLEHRFESD